MLKVNIVEDDEDIRELVSYALEAASFECKGFDNGADFFESLKEETPDLVLLDIMLPGEDGLSILKTLRETGNEDLPVILLTAKGSEVDKVKGLNLGSDDYVTKPFGVTELIARINAVLRRVKKDQPDHNKLSYKNIHMDVDEHKVEVGGEIISLTYMEFELLKFLIMNQNIVLSRDKLMNAVWGYNQSVESRTVDMHIKTLRKKLGESGDYIKTVRNVGYKIGE